MTMSGGIKPGMIGTYGGQSATPTPTRISQIIVVDLPKC